MTFWLFRQICGADMSTWRRQPTRYCTRSLTSRCCRPSATTVPRDVRQPATWSTSPVRSRPRSLAPCLSADLALSPLLAVCLVGFDSGDDLFGHQVDSAHGHLVGHRTLTSP